MQHEIQMLNAARGAFCISQFLLWKTLKVMNLNQHGCTSAVSKPAKFHYYSQLFSFLRKAQSVPMRI